MGSYVVAEDADRSVGRGQQCGSNPEKSRLATPVRSQKSKTFARRYIEADRLERLTVTIAVTQADDV